MDVTMQFRGFIHPLWNPPSPSPSDTVSVWARIQRLYFTAKMAAGPNSLELVSERERERERKG